MVTGEMSTSTGAASLPTLPLPPPAAGLLNQRGGGDGSVRGVNGPLCEGLPAATIEGEDVVCVGLAPIVFTPRNSEGDGVERGLSLSLVFPSAFVRALVGLVAVAAAVAALVAAVVLSASSFIKFDWKLSPSPAAGPRDD